VKKEYYYYRPVIYMSAGVILLQPWEAKTLPLNSKVFKGGHFLPRLQS
jgi:hypothetical protein